jgi:hypothetical protein
MRIGKAGKEAIASLITPDRSRSPVAAVPLDLGRRFDEFAPKPLLSLSDTVSE